LLNSVTETIQVTESQNTFLQGTVLASPALGYAGEFVLLFSHWLHFSLIILRVDVTVFWI
jgi:hypothetical protein